MYGQQNVLSPNQYRKCVETADKHSPRHGFTVYLLGHTGMQCTEAAYFDPDWFNPEKRVIRIPAEHNGWSPKSPVRVREIPLATRAAEQIAHYIEILKEDAFCVHPTTIHARIKTTGKKAGFEEVTPQTFRRTYTRRLLEGGLSEAALKEILGCRNFYPPSPTVDEVESDDCWPLYGDLDLKNDAHE